MRISFTALTGQGPRDVVLDAEPDVTVDGVAQSIFASLNGDPKNAPLTPRFSKQPQPKQAGHRSLWLDGRMLDPQAPAVRELRDGAVVAVEQRTAAATVLAEPTGLV